MVCDSFFQTIGINQPCSNKSCYFCISLSLTTMICGVIIMILNYETNVNIPTAVLVFGYIFVIFWSLLVTGIVLIILFVICFILLQCLCMECCDESTTTNEIEHPIE